MNIKLISALIFLGGVTISQIASSADGTITFTGAVSSQTCTINGDGSNAKDFTVPLPTVPASSLSAAGKTSGRTPFSIALTACTPASGMVHTFFEAGPTVDATTGNLILADGGAENVQISLLNGDLSVITAGAADASQNSKPVPIGEDGNATMNFFAEYVATGVATAGKADSSVMYSLVYQ